MNRDRQDKDEKNAVSIRDTARRVFHGEITIGQVLPEYKDAVNKEIAIMEMEEIVPEAPDWTSDHPSPSDEAINHPAHYGGKDDPYEAIKVIENLGFGYGFCMGNYLKYTKRAGSKPGEARDKDLKKAAWYLDRANQPQNSPL